MESTDVKSETNLSDLAAEPASEQYAYLDRGGFSSEKFKIELRNLPKFYGIAELKKLMNLKLGLNLSKIKRPKHGSHWAYVCFHNDEDRSKAILALNGYSWKGNNLVAQIAQPAPDPFVKRKQEEDGKQKAKKIKDDKSQEERLKDATTPYWNKPYEEQLQIKENEIKQLLMKMDNEIWKANRDMRTHIEQNRKVFNGLSFEMKPIQRSPVTEGYRNKCEFTVGVDEESGQPTVGFRLGSYATGTISVAPVSCLAHVSRGMKAACLLFQEFVRRSGLAPYSPADYTGHWRQLTVRETRASGHLMLVVALYQQQLTTGELEQLKEKMKTHFNSEEAKKCNVTSVYYDLLQKRKSGEDASKPIYLLGDTHITDSILGLNFRISPQAFFQINTSGADILYQSAIEMCRPRDDTTVLDICCGTGTIGLCFAKHCKSVLGVEVIAEAVSDAKHNARLNAIDNCDFFVGRAEDTLGSMLARANTDDVVAVVDPPRPGLHMRAVTQLRNAKKVNRLVYVSCSPAAALKNFVDLARPASKTLRGAPFAPVRAVAVDMFPHTRHVELAVLFERVAEETNLLDNGTSNIQDIKSEENAQQATEYIKTEENAQQTTEYIKSEVNAEQATEYIKSEENAQQAMEDIKSEENA